MNKRQIKLKKVRVHNLRSVDLNLDANQLIVFTGVSGSGKSSLAFDTLYAEGQRRYVESLSTFARRQLGDVSRPEMEHAEGITPTISIEQKTAGRNPRSTVGTMTEIYDYMRVLYARIGIPHCPVSGEPVQPQSRERIIRLIQTWPQGAKVSLLAPFARQRKAEFKEDFRELLRKGFTRVRVDGQLLSLMEEVELDGSVAHDVDVVIDRLKVSAREASRISEAVTLALEVGKGTCLVQDMDNKEEKLYSTHAYSPASGLSYEALEPHDFSFNSPSGMCSACNGMGVVKQFSEEKVIDPEKSIAEDCCSVASSYTTVRYGNIYDNLARLCRFNIDTPWKNLPAKAKHIFLYGSEKKYLKMRFVHPVSGAVWTDYIRWRGVLEEAHQRFREAKSDRYRNKMLRYMSVQSCPECNGSRLRSYPAATEVGGRCIGTICSLTIGDCYAFFDQLQLEANDLLIAEELMKEIRQRLLFLLDVGLHYLTLDRTAPTLSGGEAQRVRLASQIGCGLVGITYILDEPSIGLHPRDNKRLLHTLKQLRDKGNTVIVVEHDEETMWEADHVVDFGPGAGSRGGQIVAQGSLKNILSSKHSLTGDYLSGRKQIAIPKKRRKRSKERLCISGATHHNLKSVKTEIPLGCLVAVTGVSGSGKSSLISDTLYPQLANQLHRAELPVGAHKAIKGLERLDKVIAIDQTPIGRNPRSNPSTYIKLFDLIRDLYCKLPESRARGYKPGRFSFNVKEGSCARCVGMGMIKIDMDFLESAWVECPHCKGRRFDHETLAVLYKGKNIYDILEMDVSEALEHFSNIPPIVHQLDVLQKVGMEYIKLGQSSTTLSGGEAQRIKLAKELVRPETGRTLYILDEPTTGLHFHDITYLLKVLHTLVDHGNTVVVIEHNMDVVKTADWIIDLGPEGGEGGGRLVATGTPEMIAKKKTPTGDALRDALEMDHAARSLILAKQKKKAEPKSLPEVKAVEVAAAEQNNLKNLDFSIPRGKLTVCTGPSGSGKSSLAFETIYAEGQRRYVESLSPYARQFCKQMPKPRVGRVEGLSPAVAIEQKAHAGNPRSTVGTMTEIYDYLRILFARLGTPHCPETGEVIQAISKDHVVERLLAYPQGEKLHILAPISLKKSEPFKQVLERFQRQGYLRIRLNGTFYSLDEDGEEIPFDRRRRNELMLVIDRLKVTPAARPRIFEAVENASELSDGKLIIMRQDNSDVFFNLTFAVESTGKSYPEVTPHTFSFNTNEGMCPECQGLGVQFGANLTTLDDIMNLTVRGLLRLLIKQRNQWGGETVLHLMLKVMNIPLSQKLSNLPQKELSLLLNGSDQPVKIAKGVTLKWDGVHQALDKAAKSAHSAIKEVLTPFMDESPCPACEGSRLQPLARHVILDGHNIADVCAWPLEQALRFILDIQLDGPDKKILQEALKQVSSRLKFLKEVGLGYLGLDRRAPTLSGGESQRIRLARQLGSGLTGVLYVLDEPTIGLHPRDNQRLNSALGQLRELGNTLLMVEHDPLTIAHADYVLDMGPGAGQHGGHITAQGTLRQIQRDNRSLTGKYLSGKLTVPIPDRYRPAENGHLTIQNASTHNLKNLSVQIPLGCLVAVTGVSGSGKSTLVQQVLKPALERGLPGHDSFTIGGATVSGMESLTKVVSIDQNPIGRTVRSDVVTYVDVLTPIRSFFASIQEARWKGLQPKHFSYNHRAGMCTHCWGLGYRRVEMHFLPAVKVTCEECQGYRLNPRSLEVTYQGKNLGEYLQSTVEEARQIFEVHTRITRILDTLISVGLGYLKLGQEMVSLSGGEAQRIKLSRDLAKPTRGKTIYLLDEPSTGLHPHDIEKLLGVLHKLVDQGHTVLFVEHNVDMIRTADHVIDLGPDAGEKGGTVVATGTPDEIYQQKKTSLIGRYLYN